MVNMRKNVGTPEYRYFSHQIFIFINLLCISLIKNFAIVWVLIIATKNLFWKVEFNIFRKSFYDFGAVPVLIKKNNVLFI